MRPFANFKIAFLISLFLCVASIGEITSSEKLAEEIKSIVAQEKVLSDQYQSQQKSQPVLSELNQIVSGISFTDEEAKELRSTEGKKLSESLNQKLQPVREHLSETAKSWSDFQTEYDKLEVRKHNVVMDEMMMLAKRTHETVRPLLPPERQLELDKHLQTLEDKYASHYEKKKPLSRNREYFWEYRKFDQALEPFFELAATPFRSEEESEALSKTKEVNGNRANKDKWTMLKRIVPAFFRVILRRPFINGVAKPLLDEMFGKTRGLSLELEGKGNVPKSTEPGVVNLLAQVHSPSPNQDFWATTNLEPEKAMVIWHMHRLLRWAGGHPEILPVLGGDGSNPFDKLLKQLESGKTHTLLVFPEATNAPGITGGLLPVQDAFNRVTLRRLRKEGLGFTITPVSAPYHHKTRGDVDSPVSVDQREKLLAVASPTIPAKTIDAVIATEGLDFLGTLVRQTWIDEHARNPLSENTVAGALPISEVRENHRTHLTYKTGCNAVFDQLN